MIKKIPYVLGLVSIFLIIVFVKDLNDRICVSLDEVRTVGRVIYTRYDYGDDRFYILVAYSDENGNVYELYSTAGYSKGDGIEIIYQRSNPSNAYIADFSGSWIFMVFKFLFVSVFPCAFICELNQRIKSSKQAKD